MVASLTNEQDFIKHVALSISDLFRIRYNMVGFFCTVCFYFKYLLTLHFVNIPYKNAEKVRELCQIKYKF